MTTVRVRIPGILPAAPPGANPVRSYHASGFPAQKLAALYLFDDGDGTAVSDEMGGPSGLIEHPNTSNNRFAWDAGGGLELAGTEVVSFPERSVTGVWTFVLVAKFTESIGADDGVNEFIAGIMGHRDFAPGTSIKGAYFYSRGPNSINAGEPAFFEARRSDGAGGPAAGVQLGGGATFSVENMMFIAVLSYNGSDQLRASVYGEDGGLLTTVTIAASDAQLSTGAGGIVDTTLQPMIGGANSVYDRGEMMLEAFAIYERQMDATDVTDIAGLIPDLLARA